MEEETPAALSSQQNLSMRRHASRATARAHSQDRRGSRRKENACELEKLDTQSHPPRSEREAVAPRGGARLDLALRRTLAHTSSLFCLSSTFCLCVCGCVRRRSPLHSYRREGETGVRTRTYTLIRQRNPGPCRRTGGSGTGERGRKTKHPLSYSPRRRHLTARKAATPCSTVPCVSSDSNAASEGCRALAH